MLQTLKKLLLAFAGGMGGVVVGGILSLVLLHLKLAFSVEISSLGIKVLMTLLVSLVAGMVAPRFFMMFSLWPIVWLLTGDNKVEYSLPMFLLNVSYLLGLLLFLFGVFLSLPWLVGAGLAGIVIFSFGMFLNAHRSKGEQGDHPNT